MNINSGQSTFMIPDNRTFEQCSAYTRAHAKSFHFSSYLLPREKRLAAYAVYAFCRYADDLIDHTASLGKPEKEATLVVLRTRLDDLYAPSLPRGEYFDAFRQTVKKYGIPKEYFSLLLDGVAMDLEKNAYANFAELEDYYYKVESVVGLIMSQVFGYTSDAALPHAADLGTAMQITNILRDISDDMQQLGRIYLPQDELQTFDYSGEDIRSKKINDEFSRLMKFQIARARRYYESAEKGLPFLTNDGSRTTAAMMSRIYSSILDQIEHHAYDIYSERRYVSTQRKLWMTGKYILGQRFGEKGKIKIPETDRIQAIPAGVKV